MYLLGVTVSTTPRSERGELKRGDKDRDRSQLRKLSGATRAQVGARAAAAPRAEHDQRRVLVAGDGGQTFGDVADLPARLGAGVGHFVVQDARRDPLAGLARISESVEDVD